MSAENDACQIVQIDGETVRVRSSRGQRLTEQDIAALSEVIHAARAKMQADLDAIGPHEHQRRSPFRDGRDPFCSICKQRKTAVEAGPE